MQVVSKLVKMEFKVGVIERDGDQLIISCDPNQTVKAKVYMAPEDVLGLLKAGLNWAVIAYILGFPFIYMRAKQAEKTEDS